jgi:trans-2-enoyl-CoA reductase
VLVADQAWRESGNWPVAGLVVVPDGMAADRAAVLRVNPPTAWLLLQEFAALRPGDWVLQNAATSAVGRAVIEIARHRGWKTLNVVRRAAAAEELRALGADAVVVDDEDMAAAAKEVLGGVVPRLALNAVGGISATRLAGLLGPGGALVTYGAMSREALKIPNGFLIFRDLACRGFWLTRWLRAAGECAAWRPRGQPAATRPVGRPHPAFWAERPTARAAGRPDQ